jgi:hypothetical protein
VDFSVTLLLSVANSGCGLVIDEKKLEHLKSLRIDQENIARVIAKTKGKAFQTVLPLSP